MFPNRSTTAVEHPPKTYADYVVPGFTMDAIPTPIPLVVLAMELDTNVKLLALKLADHITTDETGLRVVPRDVVAGVIAGRAEQAAAHKAERVARLASTRAAGPRPAGGRPLPPNAPDDLPALAVMMAGDDVEEARKDAAAERLNDYMSGTGAYHRIQDEVQ
ncbi:MAG TPA: hypothetical protein PLZ93_02265 [Nocardioides sp.]|uniref:hypothetical protein n=1 Tax=uncultured Nocardioides sp. TaxID=198441 RepID=UPI000EEE4FB8|nr:hypothetical protein [uncultured Nocardioides sp.]HCB06279.1 hypothetical protein [Nocardioides sp.]HRD61334.1 hypothetical protein [Nocardioides sp.]HRI94420.1 hypothetical protein [Nocardioides sp.]HRK44344.1 hypothetical protein [Nocardioides sp.]